MIMSLPTLFRRLIFFFHPLSTLRVMMGCFLLKWEVRETDMHRLTACNGTVVWKTATVVRLMCQDPCVFVCSATFTV